jgi:hypothetical protein
LPPTERERCEHFLRALLGASDDGLYRPEVLRLAREQGFAPRFTVGIAKSIGVVQVRQGRKPSVWRLA